MASRVFPSSRDPNEDGVISVPFMGTFVPFLGTLVNRKPTELLGSGGKLRISAGKGRLLLCRHAGHRLGLDHCFLPWDG